MDTTFRDCLSQVWFAIQDSLFPECERQLGEAALNLPHTEALINRLQQDRSLAWLCSFDRFHKLPDAATFSHAYAEFARLQLPQRVHAALIHIHQGGQLIGHLSRDSAAIEARERPKEPTRIERQLNMLTLSKMLDDHTP